MVDRQERAIRMLVVRAQHQFRALRRIVDDDALAEILNDESLGWVRSKKCPNRARPAFYEAFGYVRGAAHALDIAVEDLILQLFDAEQNEDALIFGYLAKYAKSSRDSQGK